MKTKLKLSLIFLIVFIGIISLVFLPSQSNESIACADCNVILISIDTLRADHLGIYGYQRNTSSNIDSFFKNGFVFKNAFSQAPNTLPSHMSIFTGLYPSRHKLIVVNENA